MKENRAHGGEGRRRPFKVFAVVAGRDSKIDARFIPKLNPTGSNLFIGLPKRRFLLQFLKAVVIICRKVFIMVGMFPSKGDNMKKLGLLTLVAILAASTMALADEVLIIGTAASSNYSPWWGSSYNALRFMCLWEKSEIAAVNGGYINKIEMNRSATSTAQFNNVRIYLGHSNHTALETTFANNYDSFTPVQVLNASTYNVTGNSGEWWDMGITPNTFNYNNTNNLIMEIRWNGDNGASALCYRANGTNKRMWALNDDNATTGSVFAQGQYIRLTIANTTSVMPASLGRIKSTYR